MSNLAADLQQLAQLHENGVLTVEEFQAAKKARIASEGTRGEIPVPPTSITPMPPGAIGPGQPTSPPTEPAIRAPQIPRSSTLFP
jgi:Short C-terminal domain